MADKTEKEKSDKKADNQPKNYDDDLRRLEISQMQILALKRPKEFKKIAEKIELPLF